MSLTHLCLSVLVLNPELSATLITGLLAAVPVIPGATTPEARKATLIQEMNELHPRDMQEATLAAQFLIAAHNAQVCFSALEGLDPASREASRLRRDAMALQRIVIATQRALHKSQARPMLADAESGAVRPTVPEQLPTPARGGRTARQESQPMAANAAEASVAADAAEKFDPYKADPSLARFREKWDHYKRWEDMTVEERLETFGYGANASNNWNANPNAAADTSTAKKAGGGAA